MRTHRWREAYLIDPYSKKATKLFENPYTPKPYEQKYYEVEGVYLVKDHTMGMSEKENLQTRSFLSNLQAIATGALGMTIVGAVVTGASVGGLFATSGATGAGAIAGVGLGLVLFVVIVVIAVLILAFGGKPEDATKGLERGFSSLGNNLIDKYGGDAGEAVGLDELPKWDDVDLPSSNTGGGDINVSLPEVNIDKLPPELRDVLKNFTKEDLALLMANWQCAKKPFDIIVAGVKKQALCKQNFKGKDYYQLADGTIVDNAEEVKDFSGPILLAGGALLLFAVSTMGGDK